MTKTRVGAALAATLLVLSLAPAQAGRSGAGPAGTGSLALGTLITPETLAAAIFGTDAPGTTGTVRVSAEQAGSISTYLSSVEGAVVSGSSVTATGAFADGTRFSITVDTATGTLTISRR